MNQRNRLSALLTIAVAVLVLVPGTALAFDHLEI